MRSTAPASAFCEGLRKLTVMLEAKGKRAMSCGEEGGNGSVGGLPDSFEQSDLTVANTARIH